MLQWMASMGFALRVLFWVTMVSAAMFFAAIVVPVVITIGVVIAIGTIRRKVVKCGNQNK